MRSTSPQGRAWLLGGLVVCLLIASCDRREGESPQVEQTRTSSQSSDFLVRVGQRSLANEEFDQLLPPEFRGLLTPAEKRGYLDRWVDTELLYQAAEARGLLSDPELRARLEQQRREFISNHLLQKVLDQRVLVTEAEIADYYAEHLEEYSTEYRYREIVVHSQQEADDIYKRLKANRISFTRAAETSSLSSSARMGGDMGWLAKGGMPPEVEDRIVKMKAQEVSPPFETAWGWTIIELRETRQSENTLALLEVKDEILRLLTMERRRQVYAEFLEELQESYGVTYHSQLEERLSAEKLGNGSKSDP